MMASRHPDRSAGDLVRWFDAGSDGARRSSFADRAVGCLFNAGDRAPRPQTASATLDDGHYPRRRTIFGRARTPPPASNRHSA